MSERGEEAIRRVAERLKDHWSDLIIWTTFWEELNVVLREAAAEERRACAERTDVIAGKLRNIAGIGEAQNARLREHGYVFRRDFMCYPEEEVAQWEYLAFWMHTAIWEAATWAMEALDLDAEARGQREDG